MSATDKIKNAAQGVSGKAKEAAGGAAGDEELRAEGKGDQTAADLKQRGEHVKDAFKG
ncbi:CsbD family protein [Kineococcus indalonis]|uniref:CsbD family protein n=1 Tax=Kineococcus indalonis TaxID=2696566 RepID=UPI0014122DF4|nr:CsbD family protein [Kineococcus indalonis]NAZ87538.1 CsbD family protein [Kineococcus indalonis]